MNIDGIFKLIDAGFTADDIKKMYDESKDEPLEVEPKDEPPKGEGNEPIDIGVYTKPLEDKINELVATVAKLQTDNIDGAQGGTPTPPPSIEEMVANFTKNM